MIERAGQGALQPSVCGHDACRFTLTGLRPGTGYTFRLQSRNAHGWSGFGPATPYVSTERYELPPSPPAPLPQSAAATAITVRVGLGAGVTATPPVLHYEGQYRAVGGGASQSQGMAMWMDLPSAPALQGIPWSTLTATSLAPNATYEFRARAVSAAGPGPFSAVSQPISTTGSPPVILAAPFLAPNASVTDDSVEISWLAPSPALPLEHYDLRYRVTTELAWAVVERASLTPLDPGRQSLRAAVVTGLRPHTAYVFSVRASLSRQDPTSSSPWSPASKPVRTLQALHEFSFDLSTPTSTLETVMVTSSQDAIAGGADVDYVAGVGAGGADGRDGGDGMVSRVVALPAGPVFRSEDRNVSSARVSSVSSSMRVAYGQGVNPSHARFSQAGC
jgi:hypothetical protein